MSKLTKLLRTIRYRLHPAREILSIAQQNSLCPMGRLIGLRRVAGAAAARRLEGDFVECGVFRGGSAAVISERLLAVQPNLRIRLFDVFTGMPKPGPKDPDTAWGDVGKFVSGEGIVRETLRTVGIPDGQVDIHVGLFENTFPSFTPGPVAFLHVDCDWHDAVRMVLDKFFDAVVPGGTIVFDDYGFWSGCRRAVDGFIAERALPVRLIAIDQTSHYFIKP
jgi:O-methyltransferase